MNKTSPENKGAGRAGFAEDIGVSALQFLAGDPVQLRRFLDLSGLEAGELRRAAAEPAFFAGLLDHLLGHEPTLMAFCAESGIDPLDVRKARETLGSAFGTVPS